MLPSYKRLLGRSSLLFSRSLIVLTPDFAFPLVIECVPGESSRVLAASATAWLLPALPNAQTESEQDAPRSRAECLWAPYQVG
jgi:hypothetical protein